VVRGGNAGTNSGSTRELDGSLLYRGSLSAPLDGISLVLGINRLPPGPGASVLAWTTTVIALVFTGGFYALYRLGLGQIRLARQHRDFVSAVSHELKTPLTSIRMYSEMLKSGMAEADKRQQYYEYIHDESERLTRLIGNVLQLARITREDSVTDQKQVHAGALVDQVRSKIERHAETAGFALDWKIEDDAAAASLLIDEDAFLQIVINLVDNAIKFSANASIRRIDIHSTLDQQGKVIFRIRDYGPGIPPDQVRKIFGLFYRPDSGLTRDTAGTGIGLAIVQQLTTAMGGQVDVENCTPGAAFTIAFPTC
jgi:signal transduction histidine kinase